MPSLLEEKLKVSFLIGYKKTNFKWEARGGTYIYPLSPGDFSKYSKRTFPDEPAISYEQTIKTPYVGIGLAGNLERFKVSSRLIFSKWAAFEAEDRHYTRDFRVYYKMKNGKMYSYNINALYDLTNHFSLGLGYDYTNYDTVRDDSTWDYGDLEFVFIDNGGANLKTSILSSTLTYSF